MSRRLPLAEEGDEYLAVEQVVLEMEMGKPVVSSSKVSLVRKLAFPPSSVSADSNFPDAERALLRAPWGAGTGRVRSYPCPAPGGTGETRPTPTEESFRRAKPFPSG